MNPGAIVFHDGVFHMLRNSFTEFPGPTTVTHLTSDDGFMWRESGAGPVFGTDFVPFADSTVFMMSAHVDGDGTWVGYFYTNGGRLAPGFVGRASAPAPGGPWVSDPKPVLEPGPDGAWDGIRVGEPSVVVTEEGLLMYYTGSGRADRSDRLGLATSSDGVIWSSTIPARLGLRSPRAIRADMNRGWWRPMAPMRRSSPLSR